jgi:adhesin transport system outer membrane protein
MTDTISTMTWLAQNCILACLAVLSANAWAAPITFDQALQAALSTHPLVQGKRSAQDAAKADQEGAEWQRYPSFSVEANAATGGDNASVFRLDQPIWNGGRIQAGIDAAGSRHSAAGTAIDETRQELAIKVITASGEVLRLRERQKHAQASVGEHEKLLAMIRRRVQQEVSPLADQRLAESRLYSTLNELSVTNQGMRNALTQLGQLTGETITEIDTASYVDAASAAPLIDDLARATERALAHSPVLRRLSFESEAANADIDSKRSAYMPQLALRLESTQGSISDNRALLVLQAQPGAGLSARSGVNAAVARRESTRQAMEAAQRDVRQQLALDWNEWTAARARAENAEQVRSTSAEVSESYARQYTAGRKTWLDVLNAVREATQAELNLVDSRSQMHAAMLRLKVQTGALDLAAK